MLIDDADDLQIYSFCEWCSLLRNGYSTQFFKRAPAHNAAAEKYIKEQIRELEAQIKLNEMLPADMQCSDEIDQMKEKLEHLRAEKGAA